MTQPAVPIRRVRSDGTVDELGHWSPASRELRLARAGFPLTGPGVHAVPGELPWVFDEIAPDGFVAARFARWFPELGLPARRDAWSAANVVAALTRCGHDLVGNLLIGDETLARYQWIFAGDKTAGPSRAASRDHYLALVDDVLASPSGSSVGGSRPKFGLRLADGTGLIVKFTPPLETDTGRRWADLLRMEAHSLDVLREAGIPAARAHYVEQGGRGFLEVDRFDRLAGGGRVGHVTLYYLGITLLQEVSSVERVAEHLEGAGQLGAPDAATLRRIHAFSRAIVNTDTHLGNYGLLIDDDGRTTLAPAYDVLPMAFAPRHDELPDRVVTHAAPTEPETRQLVDRLAEVATADAGISPAFRDAWLRAVT